MRLSDKSEFTALRHFNNVQSLNNHHHHHHHYYIMCDVLVSDIVILS